MTSFRLTTQRITLITNKNKLVQPFMRFIYSTTCSAATDKTVINVARGANIATFFRGQVC